MFMCAPIPAAVPPEPIREKLLHEHRLVQVIAALAAQLGRILQTEQALGRELGEHLIGKPALGLPLLGMRSQLAIEETVRDSRSSSCSSVNGGVGDEMVKT